MRNFYRIHPLKQYYAVKVSHKIKVRIMPVMRKFALLSERCARKFKRKAAQVMCFRSQKGVDWFCDGLSIIQSVKAAGKNLYEAVAERFHTSLEV